MGGSWGSESRSYNALLQMTGLTSGSVSMTYNFSGTQNNGKIVSEHDNSSGETVTYAYDMLNRLAAAAGSGWGQSYAYDGFGNLTDISTTAGSTEWHAAYNASTNRTTFDTADANGNFGPLIAGYYDGENRMVLGNGGQEQYAYAPDNKRVWKAAIASGSRTNEEFAFWSVTGQRIATYSLG